MKPSQIEKRTKEWTIRLGLINWNIEIEFSHKKDGRRFELSTLAETDTHSRYLWARIVFNRSRLKDVEDDVIVHELVHVLNSEYSGHIQANMTKACAERARYYEERHASKFAAIIVRSFNHGGKAN